MNDHPMISEELFFYAEVSGLFLHVTRLMWVRHLVRMPLEHLRSSMRPFIFVSVRWIVPVGLSLDVIVSLCGFISQAWGLWQLTEQKFPVPHRDVKWEKNVLSFCQELQLLKTWTRNHEIWFGALLWSCPILSHALLGISAWTVMLCQLWMVDVGHSDFVSVTDWKF